MANFENIKQVRLRIADPANVIELLEVGTPPDPYLPQTAYKLTTDGQYYVSGSRVDLRVADSYLSSMIDSYGVDKAVCMALSLIIANLGNEFIIVKNKSGSDDTELADIISMLNYYKALKKDCNDTLNSNENNSTGRFISSKCPEIAGGNV